MTDTPFWRTTPLALMSSGQWESLCDGCGRCCLVKLEDEDTGQVAYTDVACRLLDGQTCRCTDYANRQAKVPDCVRLTPEAVHDLAWLPPTCAYRLLDEGRDLPWWHPLVSGDPATVAQAGISVAGRTAGSEDSFAVMELMDHLVSWPVRWPRGAKSAPKTSAPKTPAPKTPVLKASAPQAGAAATSAPAASAKDRARR